MRIDLGKFHLHNANDRWQNLLGQQAHLFPNQIRAIRPDDSGCKGIFQSYFEVEASEGLRTIHKEAVGIKGNAYTYIHSERSGESFKFIKVSRIILSCTCHWDKVIRRIIKEVLQVIYGISLKRHLHRFRRRIVQFQFLFFFAPATSVISRIWKVYV